MVHIFYHNVQLENFDFFLFEYSESPVKITVTYCGVPDRERIPKKCDHNLLNFGHTVTRSRP